MAGFGRAETLTSLQAVTLYVNMPTTFIFIAPLAVLPWGLAHVLWLIFITAGLFLAAYLTWSLGARYSPNLSLFLVCILLANCQQIFLTGNTAGIAVGLCGVAVWCFLEDRFVWAGVLCLAVSLAIKPHDAGLVWLYFLLAGASYRKRALQTLAVTAVFGLMAFLWISHVAPHWRSDWQANMATISAPGGINEPGPNSLTGQKSSTVVDLQAALSIFRDDPRVYNPISYLICGLLLLLCYARALRSRFSRPKALLALAAVSPLTMLITYHRPWDARLLLLAIPACAMLWAEGGRTARIALLVTTAGVVLTGDIPLAAFTILAKYLHVGTSGFFEQVLAVVLMRPAPLIMLAMGIFYLWAYLRRVPPDSEPT